MAATAAAGTVATAAGARDATRLEPLLCFSHFLFFFIMLIFILDSFTYESPLGINEGSRRDASRTLR
jgi:hypothetical protein